MIDLILASFNTTYVLYLIIGMTVILGAIIAVAVALSTDKKNKQKYEQLTQDLRMANKDANREGCISTDKVAVLLAQYRNEIPDGASELLRMTLENTPDNLYNSVVAVPTKSAITTLLFSIFLGGLGIDRFYIGDIGLGVAKLLFGWITLGVWAFVDIFITYRKAKDNNLNAVLNVCHRLY